MPISPTISPRRQRKYARAVYRKKRRTKIRRERRRKRSAAKPKIMENNFTKKDVKAVKIAQGMIAQYATRPKFHQPTSLPLFMASVTKLKSFFAREVPRIHPKSKMTPDEVIESYRNALESKASFLFHDLDEHIRLIEREAPGITKEIAYALVKEVWMPKKAR